MMKPTHIAAGITISTMAAAVTDTKISVPFVAAAALGSILPDADHPRTAIHRSLITIAAFAVGMYLLGIRDLTYTIAFYLAPILAVTILSHHRGLTHSIAFVGLIAGLAVSLKLKYGIDVILPLTTGVISHLLMDCLTPHGCELLAPFNDKNYSLPITVTTGSPADILIGLACTIYLVNNYLYPIKQLL